MSATGETRMAAANFGRAARRAAPFMGVAVIAAGLSAWFTSRSSGPQTSETQPASQASLRADHTTDAASAASVILPTRSLEKRPALLGIPEVGALLDNPPSLTLEVEVRGGTPEATTVQRKTVTRTSERIHVRFAGNGLEWLFVRNPIDRRRMSATLVEHRRRTLVEYDESELRNGGLGRGWADVVALGFEAEHLSALRPSGKAQESAGFRFAETLPVNGAEGKVRELWWSDQAAVPLIMVLVDGATRSQVQVRSIRRDVDSALLRDTRERFPAYSVMDVADYREKHHESSDATHSSAQHQPH